MNILYYFLKNSQFKGIYKKILRLYIVLKFSTSKIIVNFKIHLELIRKNYLFLNNIYKFKYIVKISRS